jgi:hypothetical protein
LQCSPCNFKTPYLFNRNSVLIDFGAKSFIATKSILSLHHIVDNPLFPILFYLFCSLACFWFIDHRIENKLPENFQDINFEDIEQQQAGFKGKCPWRMLYPFFCIYLKDCVLVVTSFVGNPSVIPFHILSFLPGLGRI